MENKIIKIKDLKSVRKKHKKIGFCSGCFDLFHAGHAVFLNKAKSFCGTLVVGVGRDKNIRKMKGKNRPVNPEKNRLYIISSLKSADYVIFGEKKVIRESIDFYNILKELRPDYLILNSDVKDIKARKDLCKDLNIKLKIFKRDLPKKLKPTSTTEIIKRIKSAQ